MSTEAIKGQPASIFRVRGMLLQFLLTVGLAIGIMSVFGKQSVLDLLLQGKSLPVQAAWGTAVGLMIILPTVGLIVRVPWLEDFRRQLIEIVARADLSGFNPLWFSLCAGVGEEMLFRGALQPLLGLWLTSLIFTALHYQTGGFLAMNRMKAMYAVLVFLASLLLGTVCLRFGLIAAMFAHTVVDVVALTTLRSVRS
jgi:membrane protease YdiL (CAAX protease family)